MINKETESIWKALHEELPADEQRDFQKSLAANALFKVQYGEAKGLHEGLQAANLSEEAWLDGMTRRILEQMDKEENPGRLSFVQHRSAQWMALAAVLVLGLFSFNLWVAAPTLNWENPEIVSPEFRGDALATALLTEKALQGWHKAFEAEVNDLYEKEHSGQLSAWNMAMTFQAVDEGLSVEVNAQHAQSTRPVRSWTFFAADLEALEASRKGWAALVVRGIVSNDP